MAKNPSDPLEMHRLHWPETLDGSVLPFVMALHGADGSHRRVAEAEFARHGLTPTELDVLATLRRSPPPGRLTPSQIRESMLITSGGLTKVLRQLEKRGLVTRSTSEADRRSKPVHLTPEGKSTVEKAVTEAMAATGEALGERLTDKEIRTLIRLLVKAKV